MQTGPAIIIFSMWLLLSVSDVASIGPFPVKSEFLHPPAAMANAQMSSSTHKTLTIT